MDALDDRILDFTLGPSNGKKNSSKLKAQLITFAMLTFLFLWLSHHPTIRGLFSAITLIVTDHNLEFFMRITLDVYRAVALMVGCLVINLPLYRKGGPPC